MPNYFRGWKKSSSRNPYFRKIGGRPRYFAKNPSGFGKILRLFFVPLLLILRWFFSRKGLLKQAVWTGGLLGLLAFIFFGSLFIYYSFNLPDPNKLAARVVPESTKIFDRNGKLLYEIHGEARRTLVKLSDIPQFVKEATIAIEDKNFYKHKGISLTGIIRATIVNLLSGSARQGGSTITQQFVRSAVLTREKTFARKFKEIALALQLERKYTKAEILQLYLNEIPYGSNAYGIEAASQTLFGKTAKDLTLIEAAYLAALPKAPTYYSPYGPHKDELDARADTVLQLMYEQEYIAKQQRNQAQNQTVEFRRIGRGILAPHFVLFVQDLLAQKYGELSLQEGGLKVTTTLDLNLQTAAEEIITKQLAANETKYNVHNASLLAIDPKNGQILAMVGSRDYFDEEHDGAVNVALRPRQPGSSFKPYVYATAFKSGMSPATMLLDVSTNFGEFGGKEYIPQNYDGKTRGPVLIRQALQGSLNIPAVKTLILTGIEDSLQTAEQLGITTLKDRSRFGPALVLGGAEVKLLEHTAAYGVFATNGIFHETAAILKIEDRNGNILEEFQESAGREVLHPQIAYQITHVLSDNEARVFIFGRNNRLHLAGRPAAAKTGTTQEYRDAWTLGFVPSLVVGVWMGNNDNSPMTGGASGSLIPATVWNEFMRLALEGKPVEEFVRPEGIVEIAIDSLSGKLPSLYTPKTKIEIFANNFNLPSETDDLHQPQGPALLHSEKPEDPTWEEPVKAWALENGYSSLPAQNFGQMDPSIQISITTPNPITSLPWEILAETADPQTQELELFLDNELLAKSSNPSLKFSSSTARVDGVHQLLVQAKTLDRRTNRKIQNLEFGLGKKMVILRPPDNQTLTFPATIILESSLDIAAENVKFFLSAAAGQQTGLAGPVFKRPLNKIFHYTLFLPEALKPPKGSYALSGQIGTELSNTIVIKVP